MKLSYSLCIALFHPGCLRASATVFGSKHTTFSVNNPYFGFGLIIPDLDLVTIPCLSTTGADVSIDVVVVDVTESLIEAFGLDDPDTVEDSPLSFIA